MQIARIVGLTLVLVALVAVGLSLFPWPGTNETVVAQSAPNTPNAPVGAPPAASAGVQSSIDESRRNAIVRAIEKAAPAVVSVNVVQTERVLDPFSRDFWGLFGSGQPQYLLRQRKLDSAGSGLFIDDQGHIVTNYHVVENSDVASVTLPDGRTLDAQLVGVDRRTDLAVLRVQGGNFPRLAMGDSDNLLIGEWAIAIGNPFGGLIRDPHPSVSLGVVSANHRRVSPSIGAGERLYQDMIQTDAAINPGNSGGPLVNAQGDVIGVNTMIFSPSGGSIGLGFAIPINRVRRVADEIIRYGHRRDPWPGFKVEDVRSLREDFLQQQGVRVDSGSIVVNILSDCPAYQAGLRPGDVILGVNGAATLSATDVDFAIWGLFVGDTMRLQIDRQGQRLDLRFAIQELSSK